MNHQQRSDLLKMLSLKDWQTVKNELQIFVFNDSNSEAKALLGSLPDDFPKGDKAQRLDKIISLLDINTQIRMYEIYVQGKTLYGEIYHVEKRSFTPEERSMYSDVLDTQTIIAPQKKRGKFPSPLKIKVYTFIIGTIILVVGVGMAIWGHQCDHVFLASSGWYVGGLGASMLSAALINLLWDKMKSSTAWRMLEKSMYTNWDEFSKVRYNQTVEMTFTLKDGGVDVKTEHSFSYKVSELREYDKKFCDVSIFSDFQPVYFGGDVQDDAFHFESINIGITGFKELKWSNAVNTEGDVINPRLKKTLSKQKNGKLTYRSSRLPLPTTDYLDINFVIRGRYNSKDRIVWIFQELSEDSTIKLNRSGLPNNAVLYMSINHPLAEKILSTSENAGIVDPATGEILIKISETPDISLELDKSILPYQGFEVHWDADSKQKVEKRNLSP